MVQIRFATLADLDSVVALHGALYRRHFEKTVTGVARQTALMKQPGDVLREDAHYMLSHSDKFSVWVAETKERKIVGYITCNLEQDPTRQLARKGIVGDWYVIETHRAQGIGRGLYQTLELHCRKQGCAYIESGTWEQNKGARRAHASLGFAETRVVMRKLLV